VDIHFMGWQWLGGDGFGRVVLYGLAAITMV